MVSKELQDRIVGLEDRIRKFGKTISASYAAVEDATKSETAHIQKNYLPQVVALSEQDRNSILDLLDSQWCSIEAESDMILDGQRRHRMRWGKATLGFAKYLLLPNEINEVNIPFSTDMVIRVSRWFHTDTNLFIRFQPVARLIVEKAWGDIEEVR